MVERWNWNLTVIDEMDWGDFTQYADGAKRMYERERKAAEAAARGR